MSLSDCQNAVPVDTDVILAENMDTVGAYWGGDHYYLKAIPVGNNHQAVVMANLRYGEENYDNLGILLGPISEDIPDGYTLVVQPSRDYTHNYALFFTDHRGIYMPVLSQNDVRYKEPLGKGLFEFYNHHLSYITEVVLRRDPESSQEYYWETATRKDQNLILPVLLPCPAPIPQGRYKQLFVTEQTYGGIPYLYADYRVHEGRCLTTPREYLFQDEMYLSLLGIWGNSPQQMYNGSRYRVLANCAVGVRLSPSGYSYYNWGYSQRLDAGDMLEVVCFADDRFAVFTHGTVGHEGDDDVSDW